METKVKKVWYLRVDGGSVYGPFNTDIDAWDFLLDHTQRCKNSYGECKCQKIPPRGEIVIWPVLE